MAKYVLEVNKAAGVSFLAGTSSSAVKPYFSLFFTLANELDANVDIVVSVDRVDQEKTLSTHVLSFTFVDVLSGDVIYSIKGVLSSDEENPNSILSVLGSLDDFSDVHLVFGQGPEMADSVIIPELEKLPFYNPLGSIGRNSQKRSVPASGSLISPSPQVSIAAQDDWPTVIYLQLNTKTLNLFSEYLVVARKLGVRLIVELDPSLSYEAAIKAAKELYALDFHVYLLWSPIVARPAGSTVFNGKKVPRYAGGILVSEYLKRYSNTNSAGIPAIHRPVAGFDFPINFIGIQQKPNLMLDDPQFKELASVNLNIVKRERFPNGKRFIFNDCLTAYGDNTSVLKLANSSEISMYIDNRLKEICKRHLLKHIEGTIEDSTKEAQRFLNACTTKDRPLLRKSSEIGGYYNLRITPRIDRPHDAIDLECEYYPQGAGRAVYLKTSVTR